MDKIFERMWQQSVITNFLKQWQLYRGVNCDHKLQQVETVASYLHSEEARGKAEQMAAGRYIPVPTLGFVPKGKGQRRAIYIYSFEDTALMGLMHYALRQYRECFIADAYAAPGHKGRYGFVEAIKRNFYGKYFALTDIVSFTDSIPEESLTSKLRAFFTYDPIFCNFLLSLIHNRSYYDHELVRNDGPAVKAGCSLSTFLANVYLNALDNTMAAEDSCTYLRFIDSVVILADSAELVQAKLELYFSLLRQEGLEPHLEKTLYGKPTDELRWSCFRLRSEGQVPRVSIELAEDFLLERLKAIVHRLQRVKCANPLEKVIQVKSFIKQLNALNERHFSYNIYRSNKRILAQIQKMEVEAIRRVMCGNKARARYKISYQRILKLGFKSLL